MYKKLLAFLVAVIMAVSSAPLVTASTDGGASEDGTGDSQQSIQNYTVYSPPYDLPGTGWTDKDGFANATWATNSSRGYIGCGVDGSGAYLGQGEAAAMQPLEVKVGRDKKITVDANISYLCGDDIGEISKIWKHFDYETSVLDPWFEWAEAECFEKSPYHLHFFGETPKAFYLPVSLYI